MNKRMSRSAFDEMSAAEQNEFISRGGWLYDGDSPLPPPRQVRKEYFISRRLYDSLTESKQRALGEQYAVVIVD